MGGIIDALGEIIGVYVGGAAGADFGAAMDDPEEYFGANPVDPEGLYELGTTGELPTFQQEVVDLVNNPSVSGLFGLIPGVGVTIQSGFNVIDDIVDTPDWFAGGQNAFDSENVEEEITFGVPEPVPPEQSTPTDTTTVQCCCSCS